ncbi:histidine kinase [Anoxybacillus sp. UARK-01]|uniref:sensor histidine kinase n=1 Tax=Anoxybacillus sp. UARK-01 TaxID=1895648 RepID=UPI0009BC1F30|nr:ATP-binding protein [Anoxybacillus sp. UARK-01]OQM44167.1 histidine kinase [Anoxybacillus sp. UARK-01]
MNQKALPFIMTLISIIIICYTLLKMEYVGLHYYFLMFIGMSFLFIGIYSYIQKPNSVVIQHFLVLMLISGLAIALATPSSWNIKLAKDVEVLSISLAPYCLLKFFEHFPLSTKSAFFRKVRTSTLFIAVFSIFLYFLAGAQHDTIIQMMVRPCIVANIIISLLACIVLCFLHIRSNSDKVKNQMYLLIFGLILSFVPVVVFSLIPDVFPMLPRIPFHYSLSSIIVFPITISYLLTKQEIIDFQEHLRKISFQLLAILSGLLVFNLLSWILSDFSLPSALLLNTLLICAFVVYSLMNRWLEPLKMKKWQLKHQKIQQEKLLILQQLLNGQHLGHCAKLVADLIHQTLRVSGVCLIWKNDSAPVVLHRTGIFLPFDDAQLLSYLYQRDHTNKAHIHGKSIFFYPMKIENAIRGWIIISEKTTATIFEREEQELIEKIRLDATELFASSATLQQIENELKEAMKESLIHEQSHWLLLNEQEEEKRKLSDFLHDEILQNLILLLHKLEWLNKSQNINKDILKEIEEEIRNSIFEIREMCHELYPAVIEDLGLKHSLFLLKRKCEMSYNIILQIDYRSQLKNIPIALSAQVFRIIKELVYNAIKHSSSKEIFISVEEAPHDLRIKVKDHGVGFKVPNHLSALLQNRHLGLVTIQKRVNQLKGTLDIQSEPGAGTCVSISLPIEIDGEETNENQSIISR